MEEVGKSGDRIEGESASNACHGRYVAMGRRDLANELYHLGRGSDCHTLPVILLHPRSRRPPRSSCTPIMGTGDQHVEELQLQCTYCPDMFLPEGCFSHLVRLGRQLYSTSVRRVRIVSGL